MGNDLLSLVTTDLLPRLSGMGFSVREHQAGPDFDNALVVLESGELRIRILRERSQLFLDIGPAAEPSTWFDSAVLMDYLSLSDDAGFHGHDSQEFVAGLVSFLRTFEKELRDRFSRSKFALTKVELSALRDARAAKRLGFA